MPEFNEKYRASHKIELGYCYLCGNPINSKKKASLDHKNPMGRFHDNSDKNKELCCKSCNREKGMLTVEEYHLWQILENVRNGNKNPVNLRILEDVCKFMKTNQGR